MKLIITYALAGKGHFRAAEAIYNYIKEYCPQIELKLVDALEKTPRLFRFFYKWGYSFLIRYAVLLWSLGFWLTDSKLLRSFSRPIVSLINWINTKEFARFLIQDNPDFIISTHFLASEVCASLKRAKKIKSRLVTTITDFGVHPFWISKGTDIYVVASEFTKQKLVSQGIAETNIKEFGIPVDIKFLKQFDRDLLCKKFDIDKDRFTVLLMTGSFGLGPLEDIVNALYKEVQILVVCAANKKLYRRLKNRNLTNVKVFGYIDNPEELMAVSDIIITKPGGISISEVLAMELPPIFISAIPGHEEYNAEVLKGYGVGFSPRDIKEIKKIILDFKEHPDKLMAIKDNIKKIKKPNVLRDICNVICQGSAGVTG